MKSEKRSEVSIGEKEITSSLGSMIVGESETMISVGASAPPITVTELVSSSGEDGVVASNRGDDVSSSFGSSVRSIASVYGSSTSIIGVVSASSVG